MLFQLIVISESKLNLLLQIIHAMLSQLGSILTHMSKTSQNLSRTKQLHALIIKTHHLSNDPFYATKLIRFYANNDHLRSARDVFDKSPHQSVYLWNAIIRAHAQSHHFNGAFLLFSNMMRSDTLPDNFTFACLLRACCDSFDLVGFKIVHGHVVASGLRFDSICSSALVTGYFKLGLVEDASIVFGKIPEPDLVLYNAMIYGYGVHGLWERGLQLFKAMQMLEKWPDAYTLVGLISGFADSNLLANGEGIHGFCLKSNFDSSPHVGSSLVTMYSRCKCLDSAHRVFTTLYKPDLVTWSSLITGFSQSGDNEKALILFKKMNREGLKADPVLVASVIAANAHLANLISGCELHSYVLRQGYGSNVMVMSALIDMYSKCGFIQLGMHIFNTMTRRNIVSYNSMISGLGLHGRASQAFTMFDELQKEGFKPDESTFSALLSACCHAGLVKDGKNVFNQMKEIFGVPPRIEHYVYMVKLLGMSGELDEAYNLVVSLPDSVDSTVWGALLSCCDASGNTKLAEIVAQHLFEKKPEKSAYKIVLSNLYAGEGKWGEVETLRGNMVEVERGKIPGMSWVGSCDYLVQNRELLTSPYHQKTGSAPKLNKYGTSEIPDNLH